MVDWVGNAPAAPAETAGNVPVHPDTSLAERLMTELAVYLEIGPRRTFAGAVEWPGWCRSGSGEDAALEALVAYGTRYRSAMGTAGRGLVLPKSLRGLTVAERLAGDATTDFGAPAARPVADDRPLEGAELSRQVRILEACWSAFDRAADAAAGAVLRTGPRGGGRDVEKMRAHVADGDAGYLSRLGGKLSRDSGGDAEELHSVYVETVTARSRGDVPDRGPRGGLRWPARYAIRRSAWHALDHAWEIEDRVEV